MFTVGVARLCCCVVGVRYRLGVSSYLFGCLFVCSFVRLCVLCMFDCVVVLSCRLLVALYVVVLCMCCVVVLRLIVVLLVCVIA